MKTDLEIPKINGPLFKRQRELLFRLELCESVEITPLDRSLLNGLNNLMDHLADYYHDAACRECPYGEAFGICGRNHEGEANSWSKTKLECARYAVEQIVPINREKYTEIVHKIENLLKKLEECRNNES